MTMKRFFTTALTAVVLLSAVLPASAQKKSYIIGFYNLENLFDIYDDPAKNDEEYLPDGKNNWTEVKYQKKVSNMAQVIRAMKDDNKVYHAVLGVSEIENRLVLEDLVSDPQIADANYQIVHYDGPDRRGVDVAALQAEVFPLPRQREHPVHLRRHRGEDHAHQGGPGLFPHP